MLIIVWACGGWKGLPMKLVNLRIYSFKKILSFDYSSECALGLFVNSVTLKSDFLDRWYAVILQTFINN